MPYTEKCTAHAAEVDQISSNKSIRCNVVRLVGKKWNTAEIRDGPDLGLQRKLGIVVVILFSSLHNVT
jgi:hypothetical protein